MIAACLNCARLDGLYQQGRCVACYTYRYRHGAERPLTVQLRHYAKPCRGCRRPKQPNSGGFGFCPACYMNRRRAGIAMGATA